MSMEEDKMSAAKGGLEEVEKRCRANLNNFKVSYMYEEIQR